MSSEFRLCEFEIYPLWSQCSWLHNFLISFNLNIVPLVGVLKKTFLAKILHQIYSSIIICLQLSRAFSKSLESWFDAVHKEAREDRYLVGEILMNYNPPVSMKKETLHGKTKIWLQVERIFRIASNKPIDQNIS